MYDIIMDPKTELDYYSYRNKKFILNTNQYEKH